MASRYGLREDGTPKSTGFFGKLTRPDGRVSTELSFSTDKVFGPYLVPTLNKAEVNELLNLKEGQHPNREIRIKAEKHALDRKAAGKSTFWEDGEEVYNVPLTRNIPQNNGGLAALLAGGSRWQKV